MQASGGRLVDYVDERLIVEIPRKEITTDDQERVRLDYADIRELISRQPFPVESNEKIFRTKQVLREGNELIVFLASGEQKRIHGDGCRTMGSSWHDGGSGSTWIPTRSSRS